MDLIFGLAHLQAFRGYKSILITINSYISLYIDTNAIICVRKDKGSKQALGAICCKGRTDGRTKTPGNAIYTLIVIRAKEKLCSEDLPRPPGQSNNPKMEVGVPEEKKQLERI